MKAACQREILDVMEAGWKRFAPRNGALDVLSEHESPMGMEAIIPTAIDAGLTAVRAMPRLPVDRRARSGPPYVLTLSCKIRPSSGAREAARRLPRPTRSGR